jgi:hypothetical protein
MFQLPAPQEDSVTSGDAYRHGSRFTGREAYSIALSIAFTTENTAATEKTKKSKCPKPSSVLSVGSVVNALTVKYFENAGS